MPDDILGEKVAAVIVLRTLKEHDFTQTTSSLDTVAIEKNNKFQASKAVRLFLEKRLAHYKQPKEVFVVDTMPRNHLGKVCLGVLVVADF